MGLQLDLFEKNDETSLLRKEIAEIRNKGENLRKGLFVRHQQLYALVMAQQKQIEFLTKKLKIRRERLSNEV